MGKIRVEKKKIDTTSNLQPFWLEEPLTHELYWIHVTFVKKKITGMPEFDKLLNSTNKCSIKLKFDLKFTSNRNSHVFVHWIVNFLDLNSEIENGMKNGLQHSFTQTVAENKQPFLSG